MPPKRNIVQTATFSGEPVFVNEDGTFTPYVSKEIVGHRKAYTACLHLVYQHTADVYITILEVLAEKYNLAVDDMISAVSEDPKFKNMMINPALSGMDYFNKEDLEKIIPPPTKPLADVEEITEKVAAVAISEKPAAVAIAEQPVKKKRVLKLKRDPAPPPSS